MNGPDGERADLAVDDLFELLADEQRRVVLHRLNAVGEATVEDLADHVASRVDEDTTAERVRHRLVHVHLPKLADAGVVTHDAERGTVALVDGVAVEPWLHGESAGDAVGVVRGPDDAATALRETNRMFATLMSNLPGIAYRCRNEPGWPMAFVSDGCSELTGYSPDDIERGDVSWGGDVIHSEDREDVWEAVQDAVERREPFELTYRIRRKDGTVRWVWEQGRAIRDGDEVEALEGFITDVTERVRRERELERHERTIGAARDGIYTMDAEGRFTSVNPSLLDLVDHEREELLGEHASVVLDREDVERAESVIRDLLADDGDSEPFEMRLPAEEGTVPCEVKLSLLWDDGEFDGHVGVVRDVSERKERERRFEAIFKNTFQFTGLMEPDGTLVEANETALEFGGLAREDVVGKEVWDTYWFQHGDAAERVRDAVERAREGEFVRFELDVAGDDRVATIDFSVRPVTDETGDVTLLIPEGRDITERKRRERQLEHLNTVAQHLSSAETAAEISDIAVEAARETFPFPAAAVYRYSEDEGSLEPAACTDAAADLADDGRLFDPEHDLPWRAFVDDERVVAADLTEHVPPPATPLASGVVLPMGKHGVLVAGAAERTAFTDADLDAARVLAAHVETALDRVDRERSLRERAETLTRKNERLERMNRVNEVIRGLMAALIEASSREAIEQMVCDRLGGSGPYRLAWIGRPDPVSEEAVPVASAGVEEGYLDSITVTTGETESGQGPVGRAARTREMQVAENVRTDPPFEPWRKEALARDYRSVVAVPLVYEDALYGVLAVYTGEDREITDVECEVMAELGRTVGYAINAAERKAALASDRTVELEFAVRDPQLALTEWVRAAGGRFELAGVVGVDEGPPRVFFTVSGADPDDVVAAAEESAAVSDVRHVSGDREEAVFECATLGDGLVSTVIEHGAVLRELTTEGEAVNVAVELPESRDVREFAEMFETRFADADLLARRERDRPVRTPGAFREELAEALTDRQREALETAYFSGFFEWPRENTGEEVADALGVSQPTFNRHLRAAHRKLLELLVD